MKFKTTKKAIMDNYCNVICVPYCGLQYLLSLKNPIAYTVRREGWAADIYEISNNTVIVTGYGPFGNIRVPYDIYNKYERAAKKIRYNYELMEADKTRYLNNMLDNFVKEVLKDGDH